MKKRKGTIHSVDPVLFQRYLNSQEDHVLATLISEFGFKPSMMFKSSALWKHYIKWQKTNEQPEMGNKIEIVIPIRDIPPAIDEGIKSTEGPSFEDGV